MRLIMALLLSACATVSYKEIQTQDCVTSHLKVVRNKADLDFYEKIVDSCRQIHTGRP